MPYTCKTDKTYVSAIPYRDDLIRQCSHPVTVLNAELTMFSTDPLGSAVWHCHPLFTFDDGTSIHSGVCLDGGVWSVVGSCIG